MITHFLYKNEKDYFDIRFNRFNLLTGNMFTYDRIVELLQHIIIMPDKTYINIKENDLSDSYLLRTNNNKLAIDKTGIDGSIEEDILFLQWNKIKADSELIFLDIEDKIIIVSDFGMGISNIEDTALKLLQIKERCKQLIMTSVERVVINNFELEDIIFIDYYQVKTNYEISKEEFKFTGLSNYDFYRLGL